MRKKRRFGITMFLLGVAAASLLQTAFLFLILPLPDGPASLGSLYKFHKIEKIISENYLYKLEGDQVKNASYKGYMAGLGDQYADYYSAEEFALINEEDQGQYQGVGIAIVISEENKDLVIEKVYENSPAEKAGLKKKDRILKINGKDVGGKEPAEVSQWIRKGKKTVVFTIQREKETGSREITVVQGDVEFPSVNWEMKEDEIGYIAINRFQGKTADQFQKAREELEKKAMKGLVIDLRDNPGGLLKEVVDTLDSFMPEGLLVYTKDKSGEEVRFKGKGKDRLDIPMVVLINQNSASAAEIFAGAVKDYKLASLVGEKTFGKGIVQTTYGLGDGSYIKFTTATYYTPSGHNIHGKGIEPDLLVKMDEKNTNVDRQLEAALAKLTNEIGS